MVLGSLRVRVQHHNDSEEDQEAHKPHNDVDNDTLDHLFQSQRHPADRLRHPQHQHQLDPHGCEHDCDGDREHFWALGGHLGHQVDCKRRLKGHTLRQALQVQSEVQKLSERNR